MATEERIAELLEAAKAWERAYLTAVGAIRIREMGVRRTPAGLHHLIFARPAMEARSLTDSKTAFRSVRQSQAAFRMLRRREGVEERECWSELRRWTSEMLRYGELLERVTGIPGRTLRRLADPKLADDSLSRAWYPPGGAMFGIYGAGRPDRVRRGADLRSNETVRSVQGVLARLASDHSRAQSRLERAEARRAAVISAQDKAVAAAQHAVDQVVAEMAKALGPELTAGVLEMRLSDVRRLVKVTREGKRVCD